MFTLYLSIATIFFLCTGNPLAAILWPINLIVNLFVLSGVLIAALVAAR